MVKSRNRGIGISIYFPKDMEFILEHIQGMVDNKETPSVSEYVCDAVRAKYDDDVDTIIEFGLGGEAVDESI